MCSCLYPFRVARGPLRIHYIAQEYNTMTWPALKCALFDLKSIALALNHWASLTSPLPSKLPDNTGNCHPLGYPIKGLIL